ncbi:MAG: hypothetical protein KDK51_06480, partial [Deltaproteobacteria bacterium]|nr:hypothetical protein [Deltaproteobacteria bacterium]
TDANRTLWCWGRGGSDGTLGNDGDLDNDGFYNDRNAPTQEEGNYTDWATAEAGQRASTFGIRDDGTDRTLWSFGEGVDGTTSGDQPVQEGTDTDWSIITLGAWEFCGIRDDGTDQTLWCFGNNKHGQLGNNDDGSVSFGAIAQIGTGTTWTDIELGTGYGCGVLDNDLYCWGRNHDNELGLGDDLSGFASCQVHGGTAFYAQDCWEPELVDGDETWTAVVSGVGQSCGINSDDEMYCWGENKYGQVGIDDADTTSPTPTKIEVSM